MLSFNLRVGDDVWFGKNGDPLEDYQQLVLKETDDDFLTVLTPDEVIDIPFGGKTVGLGFLDVRVCAKPDYEDPSAVTLGLEAPSDVKILRGRIYRRELH